jgi:hypothetical protein
LTHGAARGRLDFSVLEGLQRDLPLDQFGLDDVFHADELSLVIADQDQLFAGELDRALAALEVEALRQLFLRLLDRVGDFLHVRLGNDVE